MSSLAYSHNRLDSLSGHAPWATYTATRRNCKRHEYVASHAINAR